MSDYTRYIQHLPDELKLVVEQALSNNEQWAIEYMNSQKQEYNNDRISQAHQYDPTPAELGEKTNQDIIEAQPAPEQASIFEDNFFTFLHDAGGSRVNKLSDELTAEGVPGFNHLNWNDNGCWLALTYFMIAEYAIQDGSDPTKWRDPKWITRNINYWRAAQGHKPIKPSTYQRDLRRARRVMQRKGYKPTAENE